MSRRRHRESVAAYLAPSFAWASRDETAGEALARLAREKPHNAELVCVVTGEGTLAGALSLGRLIALAPELRLRDAMQADFPHVQRDTDQETAASIALHHGVDALPVVDAHGRVLGIMPSQALLQVLRREHVEDLHRLAGIQRETTVARHAMDDPPLRRARHRLPWLLLGLIGAMLATAAMAGFETTIEAHVAVAFFVPGLVYLADAIGTQSEAIAVRGLSLTRSSIARLLTGEIRTGLLIGATLGALCFFPVLLAFGDPRLAAAVSTSVFVAGGLASAMGLLFPWCFARAGYDPAYGSGPVATVIQDLISLLVYFAIVRAFGV